MSDLSVNNNFTTTETQLYYDLTSDTMTVRGSGLASNTTTIEWRGLLDNTIATYPSWNDYGVIETIKPCDVVVEFDAKASKHDLHDLQMEVCALRNEVLDLKHRLRELLTRVNISEEDILSILGL